PASAATTKRQAPAKAKAPAVRGLCFRRPCAGLLLEAEAGELLLEAREPAAAVDQLLGAAGPGRVRLGVDVEVQRIALLAPGRAGGELGSVGHDDLDGVVIRVGVGLHGKSPARLRQLRFETFGKSRPYTSGGALKQDGRPRAEPGLRPI